MKVLVATHSTQTHVGGDYCWALEGELVTPVAGACCSPGCGCGRGFPGFASSKATTSAMVVDLPDLTRDELALAIRDGLDRQGWLDELDDIEIDDLVAEHVECIEEVCRFFPTGEVVGRLGTQIWSRTRLAA